MSGTDPVVAVYTFGGCGCRVEIHISDVPVSAMLCPHGAYLTAGCGERALEGNILISRGGLD